MGVPVISSEAYAKAILMSYIQQFRPSPWIEPFNPRTIRNMQVIVERVALVLDGLYKGEIPGKKLSKRELERLCKSLVEGQRRDIPGFEGSWTVLPAKYYVEMPSDAQVDFVFMPTYLAISILTKVMNDFPEVVEAIPGYLESLKEGYRFATLRRLRGHGYETTRTMIKTVELFEKGEVLKFLSDNPEFSPEMHRLLKEIKSETELKLKRGEVKGGWNVDYRNGLRKIMESLKGF